MDEKMIQDRPNAKGKIYKSYKAGCIEIGCNYDKILYNHNSLQNRRWCPMIITTDKD